MGSRPPTDGCTAGVGQVSLGEGITSAEGAPADGPIVL
jgi:hypothetical protein